MLHITYGTRGRWIRTRDTAIKRMWQFASRFRNAREGLSRRNHIELRHFPTTIESPCRHGRRDTSTSKNYVQPFAREDSDRKMCSNCRIITIEQKQMWDSDSIIHEGHWRAKAWVRECEQDFRTRWRVLPNNNDEFIDAVDPGVILLFLLNLQSAVGYSIFF